MTHTPIRDMVSTVGQEDLGPLGLEQKEFVWLCKLDDEEGSNAMVLDDYILEPFLEHLLEPFGW